jgi:ArsR family transcriptional regulator, lead/cadmium/zinc/bismuth-responsive transcriptional repressor
MPSIYFAPPTEPPEPILPVDNARAVARFFQALADPTRVRMLKALAEGEWCVTDLTLALEMDQPAVSHQLKYLREQGLVTFKKHGRHVYYALGDAHLREILFSSLEHLDAARA